MAPKMARKEVTPQGILMAKKVARKEVRRKEFRGIIKRKNYYIRRSYRNEFAKRGCWEEYARAVDY